ncbi:MAG: DUF4340 domain-containing protein, partial [Phycisphaerales bacterium]|nr:DUF4340 domain-containing protein [Phycisphaerales bacterium]
MSIKAVIAVVALALLLGGGLFLMNLNRPAPPQRADASAPAAAPPLLAFNPGDVASIRVIAPGGKDELVRLVGQAWVYDNGASEWPVTPDAPTNLLRRLADLRQAEGAAPAPPAEADAVQLRLTMRDGAARIVRFSGQPLAGKTAAAVDGAAPILVDADILTALTAPGLSGWRVRSALPGVGPNDTDRITIVTGTGTDQAIELARLNGVWFVQRPVNARANPQGVNTLLDVLSKISVNTFVEAAPSATPKDWGLDKPRMIITAERDVRSVDATQQTAVEIRRRQLFVGGPADTSGAMVFAAPDPAGNTPLIVPAADLSSISTSLRNYLAATAASANTADVQVVAIKPAVAGRPEAAYKRQLDQWVQLKPDGSTTPAPRQPVDDLLNFLTQQPGQADMSRGETDLRPLARVELFTAEAKAPDLFIVGYTANGALAVRSGNTVLTYPQRPAPEVLALPAFSDLLWPKLLRSASLALSSSRIG